jgi:hypothetical protein
LGGLLAEPLSGVTRAAADDKNNDSVGSKRGDVWANSKTCWISSKGSSAWSSAGWGEGVLLAILLAFYGYLPGSQGEERKEGLLDSGSGGMLWYY